MRFLNAYQETQIHLAMPATFGHKNTSTDKVYKVSGLGSWESKP